MLLFLGAVVLAKTVTALAYPPDGAFIQYFVRDMEETILPNLLGDPYYFNKREFRQTEARVSRDLLLEEGTFSSIERSIFTTRPNMVEHALSIFVNGNVRITYASSLFSCYSEADHTPRSLANYYREYAGLPRPAVVVASGEAPLGLPIFRSWASSMEQTNQPFKNLSWCLSATPIETLGIQPNYSVSVNMPAGSPRERFVREVRQIQDDPSRVLAAFEDQYRQGLTDNWRDDDFHLRYRILNVELNPDYSTDGQEDVTDYFSDGDITTIVGKEFREVVDTGQYRIRKKLLDSLGDDKAFRPVSNFEFAIAAASALVGTAVEDILLLRIIQGRHAPSDSRYMGPKTRRFLLVWRSTLILSLVFLDLLPLGWIVGELARSANFVGRGTKSYVAVGHPYVPFTRRVERRPAGFGFLISMEAWNTVAAPDNRYTLGLTILILAVLVHIAVLGGHCIMTLKFKSCSAEGATRQRQRHSLTVDTSAQKAIC